MIRAACRLPAEWRLVILRGGMLVSVAVLTSCASGNDSRESATSVAPAATQVAEVPTSIPDTGPGESTTTVGTAATQIVDTLDSVPETPGVQPDGFTTATVRITEPNGEVCEVCMWLADDATERGRGLMGVTDLGDAAGMAFVFERPTTGSFFMFQTVTPLSIAWFAPSTSAAGREVVSIADMEPCLSDNSSSCERFPAGGEFDLAIEVFQGDLASIGIEPGSTAIVLPDTEAETCPDAL